MESRTFSKVHTRRGSEWRVRKGSIPDADEEVEVTDFKAIFQVKDDSHIETYVSQELVGAVLDHFLFKIFIMASIVGNSIIIAFQTSPFIAERYATVFNVFEQIFLTIFIWEILVKWYYGFYIFWKDGWNILDFMIIASLIVGPAVMSPGSTNVLRILRVLRVIRSIRGFAALRGVAMMVQVILQSIPDMANIFLLLVIIMLVFAVFGVTLFGVAVPSAFGDLATAMYSLFICITQDGWMSIYQQFQTEEEGLMYGAAVYFFVFLTGGAFIFANLLVAVVTTNLELAMAEYDEHSSSQGDDKVALTQKQLEEDSVTDIDTVHLEEVLRETKMTQRQKPYKYSCLENLTIESYEEFCMVLEAIQKNIKDYQKIRQELNSIVGEVQGISFNQEQEQEVIMRNKQASLLQDNLLMNEIATGRTGDMLSTLMILEKANIIDSASPSPALYQKGTVLQAAMKAKRKSIC
ncbi:cation channel sperm-associated protein 4 isoform X1 [Lepisosteus oculatus]|uniref:cation channel sperm-associated protein 4 isoform X1 n=1 Tax=Lepisosteus oculatus TaxID=7918 RepID=UPI0035F511FA